MAYTPYDSRESLATKVENYRYFSVLQKRLNAVRKLVFDFEDAGKGGKHSACVKRIEKRIRRFRRVVLGKTAKRDCAGQFAR